jgi:hypothetical protein
VPIFPFLGLQLAVEYFNSLHPSSDLNAFLVTPGVEVKVWVLHASVGARIAATDEAKGIIGGRVGVLANAGLRF